VLAFFVNRKEVFYPKYLMQASFTQDGVKGLAKEGGSKRRQAVEKFFGSAGGKLEALYFAFGETDIFVIADFPDNLSAAARSLAANAARRGSSQSHSVDLAGRDGPSCTKEPWATTTDRRIKQGDVKN
jgi:uncharacterized protein with GYD domain